MLEGELTTRCWCYLEQALQALLVSARTGRCGGQRGLLAEVCQLRIMTLAGELWRAIQK